MHAVPARAKSICRRMTGAPRIWAARYSYTPRYLWDDLGLPQDGPRGRPRLVPSHLLRT